MKLISGILTLLLCAGRSFGSTFVDFRPYVFTSLPAGFPDGVHVTIFFQLMNKPAPDTKTLYIDFYDQPEVDETKTVDITAHITLKADNRAVTSSAEYSLVSNWKNDKIVTQDITGPGHDSLWWRIDAYKIDDHHLAIWVQGFFSKVRKFTKNLSDIKSVYIYGNIRKFDSEEDHVFVKHRPLSNLVKPISLANFDNHYKEFAPILEGDSPISPTTPTKPAGHLNTSHNTVELKNFPKNRRLFLTVWFASRPDSQRGDPLPWPMIQFIPVRPVEKKNEKIEAVFTIYQQWNDADASRKSYLDLFSKNGDKADEQYKIGDKPVTQECIGDGSAADIAHLRIERDEKGAVRVTNYYVGADLNADEGKMGSICTTTAAISDEMKKNPHFDKPFKIEGLNGATILAAEASWL